MTSPSDELTYDARGGLANDFTLWSTEYDPNVVPSNAGNGFIFTAANPATQPLTPNQIERREAITAAQSGNSQSLEPVMLNITTQGSNEEEDLPFLTIIDKGVAI